MERDEDIAAFLPTPPHPAPAKRSAAIEAAMRRFDGVEETPASVTPPRAARPVTAWPAPRRAFAGAVLSAALIALIGGPIAWQKMWQPPVAPSVQHPAAPAPASRAPAAVAPAAPTDSRAPATATAEQDAAAEAAVEPPARAAAAPTA